MTPKQQNLKLHNTQYPRNLTRSVQRLELNTSQAAGVIGLSEQAIRNQVLAGRLPARRHGIRGFYRITVDDLRAFAARYSYQLDEDLLAQYGTDGTGTCATQNAGGNTVGSRQPAPDTRLARSRNLLAPGPRRVTTVPSLPSYAPP